ncbi:MAG: hypothetical protein ACKV2U_03630 [Bryobacteraceae bacterium]
MSKSNTWETDLLTLVFNNTAVALIGDASGLQPSAVAGSLYLSLHTGDPGETGTQATSETAYTGYARKAVARSAGGFTISGNAVTLVANQDFGECTASPGGALTHLGIGTDSSGAGKLLYKGALSPNITMAAGVIPRIKTTTSVTED